MHIYSICIQSISDFIYLTKIQKEMCRYTNGRNKKISFQCNTLEIHTTIGSKGEAILHNNGLLSCAFKSTVCHEEIQHIIKHATGLSQMAKQTKSQLKNNYIYYSFYIKFFSLMLSNMHLAAELGIFLKQQLTMQSTKQR